MRLLNSNYPAPIVLQDTEGKVFINMFNLITIFRYKHLHCLIFHNVCSQKKKRGRFKYLTETISHEDRKCSISWKKRIDTPFHEDKKCAIPWKKKIDTPLVQLKYQFLKIKNLEDSKFRTKKQKLLAFMISILLVL